MQKRWVRYHWLHTGHIEVGSEHGIFGNEVRERGLAICVSDFENGSDEKSRLADKGQGNLEEDGWERERESMVRSEWEGIACIACIV